MENVMYDWLMETRNPASDPAEARLFAMIIAFRADFAQWTLEDMLGLTAGEMASLMKAYFPAALADRPQTVCLKIQLHAAVKQPFVCHCCQKAVTPAGHIVQADVPPCQGYPTALKRKMEVDDLRNLLGSHRSSTSPTTGWFASMIAVGALGENHLWQDLGVSGREDVSFILKNHFTDLFNKNTGDMKWKKFFYKQLCDLDGIKVCKAPSCSVCSDYTHCFGPEDAERWAA